MLINSAARDLYDNESPRWATVESWVKDPAHPDRAAKLQHLHGFFDHWHAVDDGRWLSDPDAIDSSYADLEAAERYAAELGFPLPPGHGKRTQTTEAIVNAGEGVHEVTGLPTTIADQQSVEDSIPKGGLIDSLTSPKDLAWCQRAGVSSLICGKEGLHMPDDKTPLYLIGGGLAVLFLGVYIEPPGRPCRRPPQPGAGLLRRQMLPGRPRRWEAISQARGGRDR